MLGERGPELRRLLVQMREQRVGIAVGVDELGRRLLPHSRHAGEVVGRVASQRRQKRVQLGPDSRPLLDPRLVIEHVVGHAAPVVEHLDERVPNELIASRSPVTITTS